MVVAQLVRASVCGTEGRRFESGLPPKSKKLLLLREAFFVYTYFIFTIMLFLIITTVLGVIPFVLYWYLKSIKKETNKDIKKELDAFFDDDDDSLDYK